MDRPESNSERTTVASFTFSLLTGRVLGISNLGADLKWLYLAGSGVKRCKAAKEGKNELLGALLPLPDSSE